MRPPRRCDMGQRRRFTPEFKRQAVELLNAGQRPAAEIARELGIPRNRLYKWQKQVAAHGGAFPGSGRQPRTIWMPSRLVKTLRSRWVQRRTRRFDRMIPLLIAAIAMGSSFVSRSSP